jgi:hypothetical protein
MPGESRPPFVPGNSTGALSKGGRPRKTESARRAEERAQELCPEAIEQLYVEMKTADKASDRIDAAIELLNRGLGKPAQSVTVDAEVTVTDSATPARLELARILDEIAGRTKPTLIETTAEVLALPEGAKK